MSAFDDEFGLFDDEAQLADDDERRSTLGARTVSSGETIIDEIEMDDDERPRGRRRPTQPAAAGAPNPAMRGRNRFEERRPSAEPSVLRERAVELLAFLAKGLVSKPEFIAVAAHDDPRQGMVLELEVAADDLGKVIGRGGRVAQALRTVVRAGAEGRVAIEIIDVEDEGEEVALTVHDATESAGDSEEAVPVVTAQAPADAKAPKKPRATRARRPRAKKDADAVDAAAAESNEA